MSTLKTILRTAAAACLAAVLLLGVMWLGGCRVLIEPRHGWATETVMSFAEGEASPLSSRTSPPAPRRATW